MRAAGAPQITPTVITNLETRRRKTREITVDEVLVLAHILEVPPLQLIVPQDAGEELEVVPGLNLDALAATDWIAGVRIDDLGSSEPDADGPFARWQERLARMVGREVLRHRHRRKLSASQLADRTTELGMPVPRSVLADLKAGKRDAVAIAEVLVLAASLGVAPTELICPVGFDEQIELLPGRMMEPLQASRWVDGELALDVTAPEPVFRGPKAGDRAVLGSWRCMRDCWTKYACMKPKSPAACSSSMSGRLPSVWPWQRRLARPQTRSLRLPRGTGS